VFDGETVPAAAGRTASAGDEMPETRLKCSQRGVVCSGFAKALQGQVPRQRRAAPFLEWSDEKSLDRLDGGGGWRWLAAGPGGGMQRGQAEAVQYRTGKIDAGNLQATVSASGAVNPVTQVSVGTQVSGQIRTCMWISTPRSRPAS
jgi:hypothetical protein